MPQSTNLNVTPYYDDFQSDKDFYRVLFRPGYSIQSRELTTLQSILQNQVESVGKFLIKEGSMVVPGEISFNNKYSYVKISSYSQGFTLSQFLGSTLTGQTTGVVAKVLNATDETSSDAVTFFVRYESSGTSTTSRQFQEGEILSTDIVGSPTAVVGITGSTRPTVYKSYGSASTTSLTQNSATGYGSAVFVQEGIYYINGHFVRNSAQTLIVDKYSTTPTGRVGFIVQEELVTPSEDLSLNDNAAGFSNYAAPGAHRLKITLTLAVRNIDVAVENNFIELLRIRNGSIERKVDKRDWSDIEEILARRTYDESGDYIVKNYSIEIKNHKDSGSNNGVYPLGEDGLYNGLGSTQSDDKIVAALSPGKAYVRGYEIESVGTKYKTFDRARTTLTREGASVSIPTGSSLNLENVFGCLDIKAVTGTTAHEQLLFFDRFTDSYLGDGKFNRGAAPQCLYVLELENLDSGPTFDWTQGSVTQLEGTNQSAGNPPVGNIIPGTVKKLASGAAVGSLQNGTASTNICDRYQLIVSLANSAERFSAGVTVQDGSSGSGANRSILRGIWELNTKPIGCASPKYLTNISSSTDALGRISAAQNRDSLFRAGLFDTSMFTALKVHSNRTIGAYNLGVRTVGAHIHGSSSGAEGVVEAAYEGEGWDEVILSNVKGTFSPGEVIYTAPDYAQSGKRAQATIIKNGTIKKIHVVDGGDGYTSGLVSNPTVVTDLEVDGVSLRYNLDASTSSTPSNVFYYKLGASAGGTVANRLIDITIDDGSQSADIFPNEYSFNSPNAKVFTNVPTATITNTTSNKPATLKVELWYDTVKTYTLKDIKSVSDSGGSASNWASGSFQNATGKFSADVVTNNASFYDSVQIGTITGTTGNEYFEMGAVNLDPTDILKENDLIKVISDTGVERRYIVKYLHGSQTNIAARIYVYGVILDDVSGNEAVKIISKTEGAGKNTLVFNCPDEVIKTVAKDSTKTGFTVRCLKQYTATVSSSRTVTYSLSGENQDFAGFSSSNYIASVKAVPGGHNLEPGDILNLSSYEFTRTLASTSNNSQITWSGLPTEWVDAEIKLLVPITVKNAKPRTKILKNGQLAVSTYNRSKIINLLKIDGFRLNAIYMSGDPDAAALVTDINIRDRFLFDTGQRDNVYDMARIIRKEGAEEPSGQLLIDFDYFEHQNDGQYFSVDSYLNPSNLSLDYADIPVYYSEKNGILRLRDCVDFRPSADVQGVNAGKVAGSETVGTNEIRPAITFSEIESFIPIPNGSIDFNYDFYLPRKDSIYLTKKGSCEIIQGVPALIPQYPTQIEDSIRLFDLDVPAYTFDPKDVSVKTYNHRRYTMKDLRELDRRIETMEYYTTLSLLEQDTLNISIKDAVTGLDRFKSGIVVDNFAGHNVGDTTNSEYKCSIDMQTQQLRPQHHTGEIELKESITDDASRSAKGYKKSGSIATLEYTDEEMIKNPYATEVINLNPFLVFQYKGTLQMNPDMDEWKDTQSRPDLVVRDNNLFDTINNMADERGVLGTVWNEWQTSWSGQEVIAQDSATARDTTWSGRLTRPRGDLILGVDTTVSTSIMGRTRTRTRTGTRNTLSGFDTIRQSFGNRVIGVAFQPFMRTRPVAFSMQGMKPNTRVYAFFEGIDVNAWICPDSVYTGWALNTPKGFGQPIITDANGSISGIFIVPNGNAPLTTFTTEDVTNLGARGISGDELDRRRVSQSSSDASYTFQTFTENIEDIIYDTSSPTRQFRVGEKTLRFTSSPTNSSLEDQVDTFCEHEYFAMGLLETTERTVVSTRVPTIAQRQVGDSDQVQFVDGVRQNINTETAIQRLTWGDPVAQSILVEGFEDGVFVSSLEVFFKTKSSTVPTQAWMTETNLGTPGKKIIPFSLTTVQPDTVLRITSDIAVNFVAGETILGMTSGATGTVKENLSIDDTTSTVNYGNTVYDLVLDNYNGKHFLEDEVITIQRFPEPTAITKVAKSTFQLSAVDMTSGGTGYTTGTVTVSAPQQVGGIQATAYGVIDATRGKVIEVVVTNPGSGYTSEPSISISGDGAGATAVTRIRKEKDSVTMGVATSEDASAGTLFKFPGPVYLENGKEYAFICFSNSIDYNMYISRLGENEIGTTQRVSSQPYLGSLFKSQNSTLWTADQFEDVKFTLNRAKFKTNTTATIDFVNQKLTLDDLITQPVETNKLSYRGGGTVGEAIYTSAAAPEKYAETLFGGNPRIVMVHHRDHGMTEGDYVNLKGCTGVGTTTPIANGISIDKINTAHQIKNVGLDHYCIEIPRDATDGNDQATESGRVGGQFVQASKNQQFQVIQPQIGILQFASTNVSHTVTAVKSSSVDYINSNDLKTQTMSVIPGQNLYLTDNYQVLSEINEVYQNDGVKSFKYSVNMSTTNDAVSPVLDLDRINCYAVDNRIDRPEPNASRFGYTVYRIYPFDKEVMDGGTSTLGPIAASGTSALALGDRIKNIYKTDANGVRDFNTGTNQSHALGLIEADIVAINQEEKYIDIRYIKVPAENTMSAPANSTTVILNKGDKFGPPDPVNYQLTPYAFQPTTGSDVYFIHTEPINLGGYLYSSEENGGMGAHHAKYQTKVVTLENPATNIEARLTANLFDNKDIQVMYKMKPVVSDKNMNQLPWKYFNPKYTATSMIKSIEVLSKGVGYTTAPIITINPDNGVTATPFIDTANQELKSILVTNRGSGFTEAPTITLAGGGTGNAVSSVTIANAGTGYAAGTYQNVQVAYDTTASALFPMTGTVGSGANDLKADIVISAGGTVTGVTITTPGQGFAVGEVLTVSNTNLGNQGGGLQFTVASVTAAGLPTTAAVARATIFPVDFDENNSGLADDWEKIETDQSDILDPLFEDPGAYKEYKFSVEDLPEFDKFAVKIIMRQNKVKGPAFVPKIEDFRCIASV